MGIKKTCSVKKHKFLKRKIYVITPKKEEKTDLVIMYIHGGSYIGKLVKSHWEFVKQLCDNLKCTIIVPDYPLAPKYCYIDVFNMMNPLYEQIMSKINPKNFLVIGDSSGGGIALALTQKKLEENKKLPNKLILISPWIDVTMTNPKIDEVQKNDKVLNKMALKMAGEAYSRRQQDYNNYLVNPINGPIEGLKNITIFTGTHDILNPDIDVLMKKVKEVGATIDVKQTEGAVHNWIIENDTSDKKQQAFEELIKVIKNI